MRGHLFTSRDIRVECELDLQFLARMRDDAEIVVHLFEAPHVLDGKAGRGGADADRVILEYQHMIEQRVRRARQHLHLGEREVMVWHALHSRGLDCAGDLRKRLLPVELHPHRDRLQKQADDLLDAGQPGRTP